MLGRISPLIAVPFTTVHLVLPIKYGAQEYHAMVDSAAWPICLDMAGGPVSVVVSNSQSSNTTVVSNSKTPSKTSASATIAPHSYRKDCVNPSHTRLPEIWVKGLDGKTHTIGTSLSAKVYDVKVKLQAKTGVPWEDQRLIFAGQQLDDDDTLSDCKVEAECTLHLVLRLRGGKPVIYILPPVPMDVKVHLALAPQWSFSAIYPSTDIRKDDDDNTHHIEWHVTAQPDGMLKDSHGTESTYLFWEADNSTNPSIPKSHTPVDHDLSTSSSQVFNPAEPVLCPHHAVVLATAEVPAYLYRELGKLGLHVAARTDFITYWLGDFNRHSNIALRFLPQDEYSPAAPLETTPAAQVVTRVFMLFRGIKDEEMENWAQARSRTEDGAVDWRKVIGIDERMSDKSLFRVLEWSGMEVL